jgi:Protein of unknown function (DUF2905)
MSDIGRILILLGLLLLVAGVVVIGLGRLNVPIGRLPGDLSWRGKGWVVSFPLASSILLSVIVSLILWAINHFRR